MEGSLSEDRLKELMKSAIVEVLEERTELLRNMIEESLEEFALARAIQEGESSETISREDVFSLLEGKA